MYFPVEMVLMVKAIVTFEAVGTLLLPGFVFSDCLRTRILPPVHGDSSGVRGAAWLWADGESGPRP